MFGHQCLCGVSGASLLLIKKERTLPGAAGRLKLCHAWQLGGVWGPHPTADSPGGSDLELIVATHALCHSVLHLVFPTQPLLGCPGLCWHLVGRQQGGSQGSTLPTTHGQMAIGVAGLGLLCPPFPRAGPG